MDPPWIPEGSLRIPLELPRAPQGFPEDAPRLPPGSPRDSLGVARQILTGNAPGGPGAQQAPGARMGAKQDNVWGGGAGVFRTRGLVAGRVPEESRESAGRVPDPASSSSGRRGRNNSSGISSGTGRRSSRRGAESAAAVGAAAGASAAKQHTHQQQKIQQQQQLRNNSRSRPVARRHANPLRRLRCNRTKPIPEITNTSVGGGRSFVFPCV